jgi:hypothetical protein
MKMTGNSQGVWIRDETTGNSRRVLIRDESDRLSQDVLRMMSRVVWIRDENNLKQSGHTHRYATSASLCTGQMRRRLFCMGLAVLCMMVSSSG